MTSEEVHAHLITGLNKSFIASITKAIHDKPEVIKSLLKTTFGPTCTAKKKAAWVLRQMTLSYPNSILPYVLSIIKGIESERDSSVLRDTLKILTQVEINEKNVSLIVDRCINLLSEGKYAVAVKYLSLEVLEQQCKRWPELAPEVIEAALEQRSLYTASYKRQVDRSLGRLHSLTSSSTSNEKARFQ
jgi:hypothetical protein